MSKETYNKEDMLAHVATIIPSGFTLDSTTGRYKKQLTYGTIYIERDL